MTTDLAHYEKNGYLILRDFLSEKEVVSIEQAVDPVFGKWRSENKAEIFSSKLLNMHSLSRAEYFRKESDQRLKFFKAIAPQKLRETLESVFGADIYFHNTQLFFNPSNKARLPYWHRDMQYSPIEDTVQAEQQRNMLSLHVRIPLLEETGVELVKGSHKRWDTELERKVRFELDDHNNNEALENSELIPLKVGDILVFNAQMIHRGNYQLNSERKALDLCVGKYHELSSSSLDPQVLPSDLEMQSMPDNRWYGLAREIIAGEP